MIKPSSGLKRFLYVALVGWRDDCQRAVESYQFCAMRATHRIYHTIDNDLLRMRKLVHHVRWSIWAELFCLHDIVDGPGDTMNVLVVGLLDGCPSPLYIKSQRSDDHRARSEGHYLFQVPKAAKVSLGSVCGPRHGADQLLSAFLGRIEQSRVRQGRRTAIEGPVG